MSMIRITIVACILCLSAGCGRVLGPYVNPAMTYEEISLEEMPFPIRRTLQEKYPDAAVRGVLKMFFPPGVDSAGPSYLVRMQTSQHAQFERTFRIDGDAVLIADESGQVIDQRPIPSGE